MLGDRATAINTSVEESMLRERDWELLPHDAFIRDNIREEDILIVSIGANDVALRPLASTVWHMLRLAWLTQLSSLQNGSAWSLSYFQHLLGTKVQDYLTKLTSKTKPRAIIVCMIYFPLESGQTSWADLQLKLLGYNSNPAQLQTAIKKIYDIATRQIKIEGTRVLPCSLYEVLDGKHKDDYTARVEPNENGGRKMAKKFVEMLEGII
ncbi:hypothetical protein P154DRAFT_528194 [Amniculicola lignicola CBS 123094]|uniref:SGNH hydrolase-type esterase domain-containing protein n=1 Tax=Amniculicola lignicola CBS 123094 TaxID=1392246 RepID=A0A6A5VTM3_9PLEO|nr:hypothetical protein P154DRAFT_528194 [Amniculicola lignicola CBS 123094]